MSAGAPTGLAGSAAPPAAVSALQRDSVRRLTAQCFWHHDGERLVLGSQPVYLACRDWAERRVRVRMGRPLLY